MTPQKLLTDSECLNALSGRQHEQPVPDPADVVCRAAAAGREEDKAAAAAARADLEESGARRGVTGQERPREYPI